MTTFPRLPRRDPEVVTENNEPLATANWLPSARVLKALAWNEGDTSTDSAVLLGWLPNTAGERQNVGYDDDRHIVTIAGSRAGKGDGLIIPNLLTYRGSVVCIDPKGENASVTAGYRAKVLGQTVHVLDPFRVASVPDEVRGELNPIDWIDPESRDAIDDAGALADSIIVPGNQKEPHWDESARAFIKGVLLFILAHADAGRERSLTTLRYLVTMGGLRDGETEPSIEALLDLMLASQAFNGTIAAAAAAVADMGPNERGSVLSTVRRNTEFLGSPDIADALLKSTFDPAGLKTTKSGMTIYLVLPEWRMATHSRWLRMMISLLLHKLERTARPTEFKRPAVLVILEEFAALGYLQSIERAAGYVAGFGVKLWSILQDLSQLKDIYPRRWETFVGNAGVLIAFGNADLTTQEYLSKRIGQTEVSRFLVSSSEQRGSSETSDTWMAKLGALMEPGGKLTGFGPQSHSTSENASINRSETLYPTALMTPDEVGRYFAREQRLVLVLVAGLQPIRVMRLSASQDDVFVQRAAANPYHWIVI